MSAEEAAPQAVSAQAAAAPPESPNTNRPKQPNQTNPTKPPSPTPVSNEKAGAAEATSGKVALDDEMKKHIDSIIASKLPGLVESSAAQINKIVESRVSGTAIDAMVVASVAKNVGNSAATKGGAPTAAPVDQTDMLVKKQAEMEQRVWERLQTDLQNMMLQQQVASVPGSRPATSPRPFSSEAQARSTAQSKAAWTSGTLYTVAAVPNHDNSRALIHSDLERDVTEKVLANQPDRSGLGFNEIIMRDIANSVVRELVGIFESLLDRLLIEKKQDTLRTLVAELVTEDTLKVMATSREQLKQMELGHITRELERLGLEGREREQTWEERFIITRELRDSQDDLYATLDERCRGIEARLTGVEQNKVERTDMDERFQQKLDEGQAFRNEVTRIRDRVEVAHNQLAEQQRQTTHNFPSRIELAKVEEQLSNEMSAIKTSITSGLQELRDYASAKTDLQSTKTELHERLVTVDQKLLDAAQGIEKCDKALKDAQDNCQAVYCTKTTQEENRSKSKKEADEITTTVCKRLDDLEATKATKTDAEEMKKSLTLSIAELNQTTAKLSTSADRTLGTLVALDQRVEQTFATRAYVDDSAKNLVEEVVQRSDTREELGRLWKDFDSERERLRQSVRQQQNARKDLNDAIEDIQSLRTGAVEVVKRCELLDNSFTEVDTRETSHWDQGQEALRQQKQSHDDLNVFYKALRDEFVSHKEFQKNESESVKSHSTMCYLEQMDKALNLTESVEKVVRQHRELNDSIKSNSLPPISP